MVVSWTLDTLDAPDITGLGPAERAAAAAETRHLTTALRELANVHRLAGKPGLEVVIVELERVAAALARRAARLDEGEGWPQHEH